MKLNRIILWLGACLFLQAICSTAHSSQNPEASADIYVKVNAAEQMESIFQSTLRDAEGGNPTQQYFAGKFYSRGMGIKKDYIQAYKWLYLSALEQGNEGEEAVELRDEVGGQLTPEQIAQARQLAKDWKNAHPPSPPNPKSKIPPPIIGHFPDVITPNTAEVDVKPVPLIQPLPIYSTKEFDAGVEGTAFVTCKVDKDGNVHTFSVSSRYLDFVVSVSDAIAQWHFKPGTLKRIPVESKVIISISFSLGQLPSAVK
jgi:hypothetical protein